MIFYEENQLKELQLEIGNVCSYNFSPTCRAKLISLDIENGVANLEVVECTKGYMKGMNDKAVKEGKIGEVVTEHIAFVWNAFFF